MRDDAHLDIQFHVVPLPKWPREVTDTFNVAYFSVYSDIPTLGFYSGKHRIQLDLKSTDDNTGFQSLHKGLKRVLR